MNLKGQRLDEWFLKSTFKKEDFPNDDLTFQEKYKIIAHNLNEWVHPMVNTGAMFHELGLLTDHGPGHIRMLIKRISTILEGCEIELTPFEVYILLLSVHFHDTGNIFGRNKHSWKAIDVMDRFRGMDIFKLDRFIWDDIFEIANAHAGEIKDDPIGKLNDSLPTSEKEIRRKLLAALLRFCDELAENRTRAARFFLVTDTLPKESRIYHLYAESLESVTPDLRDHTIKMFFKVNYDFLNPIEKLEYELDENGKKKLDENGKPKKIWVTAYLMEEIYLRTLKTHYERIYCSRYFKKDIYFNAVEVDIDIYRDYKSIQHINYTLIDGNSLNDTLTLTDFYRICPNIAGLSGENLQKKFETDL